MTVRKQPKRRSLDATGLTVVENHLYPEGSTDSGGNLLESYIEIGKETSDRLEMVAYKLYVERTIRHKVIRRELQQQVMSSEYIQVDESVVPVIDNEKHKARKGYEWCVCDG